MTDNSTNPYAEFDDEDENYVKKCLCVLCLDTSNSMNGGDAIGKLNAALASFKDNLTKEAKDYLELSVITFNSTVDVIIPPSPVMQVQIPKLDASGNTHIVAAIEQAQNLIQDRKTYWKSKGMPYYRPYLIVMTDGEPFPQNQDIDGIANAIKSDTASKRYSFVIIGVGDYVKDETLNKLAAEIAPKRINAVDFSRMFEWLSKSVSTNPDGEKHQINDDWDKMFM